MEIELRSSEESVGFFARVWQHIKKKVRNAGKNVKKVGKDDPRRIVHSLKVGLALTLVSLLYYFRALYDGFGVASMWAVLTVVVVFEYTVGATLGKGLNRAFATLLAGALAVGAHDLASLSGPEGEPIILAAFVFLLATTATFARFFPKIKARYDYGVMIFILTFSLVAVSGYRVDELLELAHQRLSTIAIGSFTCVFVSIFVCPVWAGDDLHHQVANNIEKLAHFLQGFGGECLGREGEEEAMEVTKDAKIKREAYKSVLSSKTSEESLANFARWEPGHGRFRFRHPWKQYLKIASLTRQCAYTIEALNGLINIRSQALVHTPCTKMSSDCSKALTELASAIRTMTKPISPLQYLAAARAAATDLKTTSSETCTTSEILYIVTTVTLLIEIIDQAEKLTKSVEELASLANFKNVAGVLHRASVTPLPEADGSPHVIIHINGPSTLSVANQ